MCSAEYKSNNIIFFLTYVHLSAFILVHESGLRVKFKGTVSGVFLTFLGFLATFYMIVPLKAAARAVNFKISHRCRIHRGGK